MEGDVVSNSMSNPEDQKLEGRSLAGGDVGPQACRRVRSAFTLVELLTVVAIIGVLASLLLTGIVSARKKSRATVCTVNLHQISLALNMYLDETAERPSVDRLVANKYLPAVRSLICPEDKTGNWGGLVRTRGIGFSGSSAVGPIFAPPFQVSVTNGV